MKELIIDDVDGHYAREIMDRMGPERIAALGDALSSHRQEESEVPELSVLLRGLVARHRAGSEVDLEDLGLSTVADALAEVADSRRATKKLMLGKLGIVGAVRSHRKKVERAVSLQKMDLLRKLGTEGAPTIYADDQTGLHLVRLITAEHCVYDGASLHHCLADPETARNYLGRGALLCSLREDGIEPRATIEVNSDRSAVIQARGPCDGLLQRGGAEHSALGRSLVALSEHVYPGQSPSPSLVIADRLA